LTLVGYSKVDEQTDVSGGKIIGIVDGSIDLPCDQAAFLKARPEEALRTTLVNSSNSRAMFVKVSHQ
jgi:hypothetical protein